MPSILALIGLPLLFAVLVFFAKSQTAYALIVRLASVVMIVTTIVFVTGHYQNIYVADLSSYPWIKTVMLVLEIAMAAYVIYVGIKNKSYLVSVFAAVQIGIFTWFELTMGHDVHVSQALYIDRLSILMVLIIGIIGSLICLYAVEYMREYQHHHKEVKDRRSLFYTILFVFMSAMYGIVISNDMAFMLFFWEITSLCSFLLIGYTKSAEAIKNSFLALTINVFGGLCFTIGIILLAINAHVLDFNSLLMLEADSSIVLAAVFLIACAGLTKSAQMPFSKWLLGAMVAPTPTSAMLHSSTMVKAGVYLIIRLSPMLGQNAAGITITLIGGLTFFITAILAVSQSDAKKYWRILLFLTLDLLLLVRVLIHRKLFGRLLC